MTVTILVRVPRYRDLAQCRCGLRFSIFLHSAAVIVRSVWPAPICREPRDPYLESAFVLPRAQFNYWITHAPSLVACQERASILMGESVSTHTVAPQESGQSGEYTTLEGPCISTEWQ